MNPSSLSPKRFGSQWATKRFEQDHGDGLDSLGDTGAFDYWHLPSYARVELKASRPARDGHLTFQNIHPDRFDVCVFLGYRPDDSPHYWIIPAGILPRFLSIQHRDGASYQMRVSTATYSKLKDFRSEPDRLASILSRVGRLAVRTRPRVLLAPTFHSLDGWPQIAARLERRLKRNHDSRWQIRIQVPPSPCIDDYDNELVPYPVIDAREFRMDFFAHPRPVVGSTAMSCTVRSLLDFLLVHEFPEIEEDF